MPGHYVVARVSDTEAEVLSRLWNLGVVPGALVRVAPGGAFTVNGSAVDLGLSELDGVRLLLADAS